MLKLKNIEKNLFDDFVREHKSNSHFMQSLSWGEFSKIKKNLTPYYLGLVNEDDNLVGATLILEKNLPLNMSCLYIPKGFVLDYKKKEILKIMTNKVLDFAKKKKAIFIKMDPDIIKKSTNYLDITEENKDSQIIFNNMKSCGFKYSKNTKDKYTFKIDLTQNMKDIENHFSKNAQEKVLESKKLDTEVVIGTKNDISEFYKLMTLDESKKETNIYDEDYYETLYEIFNGNTSTKLTLFLGKINIIKTTNALEKKLKNINSQISILPIDNLSNSAKEKLTDLTRKKEDTIKEIEKFKEYRKEHGNEITLSAHIVIEYKDKAWVLYEANHNILKETYVNYSTYLESIRYCKENGIKTYEYCPIEDLEHDHHELFEFRKDFGGDYITLNGQWDYITNPVMYFIIIKLFPIYQKITNKKGLE